MSESGTVPATRRFEREFDRLLNRFFHPDPPIAGDAPWAPRIDFSERKDAYVVRVEAPGVSTDDLVIDLDGQQLSIRGQRATSAEGEDERYFWREREEGTFFRTLRLPAPVDRAKVTATVDQGVVTIRLPRLAGAASTRIPIK